MDYLSSMASLDRMFYMFFLGLELNVPYILCIKRNSTIVVVGGIFMCLFVGRVISPVIYWMTRAYDDCFLFIVTVMLVFTKAASPILVRMVSELKFATSDFNRLATDVAMINDVLSLFLVALRSTWLGPCVTGEHDGRTERASGRRRKPKIEFCERKEYLKISWNTRVVTKTERNLKNRHDDSMLFGNDITLIINPSISQFIFKKARGTGLIGIERN
ncbi:Cation/H(+) antiporter [Zostera marina]|uniref:Cation/H(+) antiporter n=1 Tax=Zostera marina TaxID=29655 RepID=A0A0K9PPL4_ZOSMR|nr:Cation/H(+) antiporter [Zostera marina]